MSDQPCETPLVELARGVPKDFRGEWEIQWFEDGTPCGHAMAPVGKYLHDMADEIERLTAELADCKESDRLIERLQARVEALEGLVTEAAGVCDDLITKTDVYLGINDAYKRHDLWEKKLQALAATEQEESGRCKK